MGIDPVTHEPLHKESMDNKETSTENTNNNLPAQSGNNQSQETDSVVTSEDNNSSLSQTENSSSGDDSLLLESICNDESLMNSLWVEEESNPLVLDSLWNCPDVVPNGDKLNDMGILPSLEDSCAWLLDCQDFGIHDFGLDCFNDIELNALNNLEMEEKQ